MDRIYSFEEVARFVGLTRQTLCNWSGCNSGYKIKNKSNAATGMFIVYHLYGKDRMSVIKESIKKIKEKCDLEEIDILKEEVEMIDKIYKSFHSLKNDKEKNENN